MERASSLLVGRGPARPAVAAEPQISRRLVPLLDIVFIMLLFFILIPHGMKSVQDQVKPPKWDGIAYDDVQRINLDKDGKVLWQRGRYGIDEFATVRVRPPGETLGVLLFIHPEVEEDMVDRLRKVLVTKQENRELKVLAEITREESR